MESLEKQLLKTIFLILSIFFITTQSLFSQNYQLSSHAQTGKIRVQMWSLLEQNPQLLQNLKEQTEENNSKGASAMRWLDGITEHWT